MPIFKYKTGHSHNEEILILDRSQQPWLLNQLWEALGSFADRQAGGQPISDLPSHTPGLTLYLLLIQLSLSFRVSALAHRLYVLIYLVD